MPPIGFALFLFATYGIQPAIVGVLNIVVLHRFYEYEGWQIGLWLNGFLLLLVFSTINLIIQTVTSVPFSLLIGLLEILCYPIHLGIWGNSATEACPALIRKHAHTEGF
jgi:hypothetical protein